MIRCGLIGVCLGLLLLFCLPSQASIVVSPVVIDAYDIQLHQTITIQVSNLGEDKQSVEVAWGWFDQDEQGAVVISRDPQAQKQAQQWMKCSPTRFQIEPGATELIRASIHNIDFTAIYPVMFITTIQDGMRAHQAVLFLLSTNKPKVAIEVGEAYWEEDLLMVELRNPATVHQGIRGVIEFFDGQDTLVSLAEIPLRRLLPGRRRSLLISVPDQTHMLDIVSPYLPQERVRISR